MNKTLYICIFYCAASLFASPSRAEDGPPLIHAPYEQAIRTGAILNPEIGEASGILASRKNRDLLWVVNDGGNGPVLYALSRDGKTMEAFPVSGITNTDWEDLSGFRWEGEDFLVIGDVGDNRARRDFCTLFVVKEPEPGQIREEKKLSPEWRIRFRYEDGPRDCESLAVDAPNKRILLLSKRDRYPRLYELPLAVYPPDIPLTARPLAEIRNIPRPTPSELRTKYGKYRSWPTSMDLSSDGRTLVILTYKHGYSYRRKKDQSWEAAFQTPPELIRLPHPDTGELVQREALCIDHGTGRLIITSEQIPAPIYTLAPVY